MKRITLDNYIFSKQTENLQPLYNPNDSASILKEIPDFIKTDSFQEILSRTTSMLYGDFLLRSKYALNTEKIWIDVMNLYAYNAYKYLGLYDSTQFNYNPIHNYDMIEKGNDNTNIENNNTIVYGEQQSKAVEGARNDSITHGTHTDTENTPQLVNTQQQATSPYDSNSFTNTNKTTDTLAAIDKTYVSGTYTDNSQKGEMINTGTINSHTDNATNKTLNSYTHYLERSGNIGVTSSMELIQSERDIRDFSIYNIIAKDIMCLLCVRVEQPRRYIIVHGDNNSLTN